MLQSIRNEQTLKILERLRKQGAPTSKPVDMSMTGGPDDEEGLPQPGPQPETDEEGDGSIIQDQGMPGSAKLSASLEGMKQAKKSLKRRY